MNGFRKIIGALLAGSCLMWGGAVVAHDGPEHEIEELTERLKQEGESADLLLQRAIEYNVLRKSAEAIKDLQRALDFDAESPVINLELSRAYFTAGKTNEAFDTATRGLKAATEPESKAALLMMRAEITRARKDFPKAIEYVERALKETPDIVEAYLMRSQLQHLVGQKKERIKGLEEGIKVTGSGLLEGEYIDALIEGGKTDVALAKIEPQLRRARLRSTWLIRRAKVFLAQEKYDEADEDLKDAIEELDKRLGVRANDPLLLVDRGEAYDLLGKKEEAKKDYESARDKGVTDEWVRERIHALGGKDRPTGRGRRGGGQRQGEKKEEPKTDSDNADEKPDDKADDKNQ
jgi:tetratricopeptide (TPR) repeat protein